VGTPSDELLSKWLERKTRKSCLEPSASTTMSSSKKRKGMSIKKRKGTSPVQHGQQKKKKKGNKRKFHVHRCVENLVGKKGKKERYSP